MMNASRIAFVAGCCCFANGVARADCATEKAALQKLVADAPKSELDAVQAAVDHRMPTDISALPLGPATKKYAAQLEAFAGKAKCPAEAAHADYEIAELYATHFADDVAVRWFDTLIDNYPESDKTLFAMIETYHILGTHRKYADLSARWKRYYAVPTLRTIMDRAKEMTPAAIDAWIATDRAKPVPDHDF